MTAKQQFGGDWTTEKLNRLRKYISAYTAILSKQPFSYAYIDAFAGTGYRELKDPGDQTALLFPELADPEPQGLLQGSARIALQCEPGFHKYVFIEKDAEKLSKLKANLYSEFPCRQKNLVFSHGDANTIIRDMCSKDWSRHRAVLFLDPFGMQVTWSTIEAIARTKAIDLWILFPLGVAVNRMLTRNGQISDAWTHKLDECFGCQDWYDAFYRTSAQEPLFSEGTTYKQKTVGFSGITVYYVNRLKVVFQHVAENPLLLYNSKNIPLYALFFAAAHPSGGKIAVRIAHHILGT